MSFKYLVFTALFFTVISCDKKDIPRYQKRVAEEKEPSKDADKGNVNSYSKYKESNESDFSELEKEFFLGLEKENKFYISREFSDILYNYVSFLQKMSKENKALYLNKIALFKEKTLDKCLGEEKQCEVVYFILKKDFGFAKVLVDLSKQQSDSIKKLQILSLALNYSAYADKPLIESEILQIAIEGLISDKIKESEIAKYYDLILNISLKYNWKENKDFYLKLKPWTFSFSEEGFLKEIKKEVLFLYPELINKDAMKEYMSLVLPDIEKKYKGLSNTVAFKNLSLESFKKESTIESVLSLMVFNGEIGSDRALEYYNKIKNKDSFNNIFQSMSMLIKYEIAYLTMQSSTKLSKMLLSKGSLNKSSFQKLLDESKAVNLIWSDFHKNKATRANSFLTAIEPEMRSSTDEFFKALNRNIYKLAIYPNMLAFNYYLNKYEWRADIKILWFTFTVDSKETFERLLLGKVWDPWFDFVSLSYSNQNSNAVNTTALTISEIKDSLYYFFTTDAYKHYNIDIDDFMLTVQRALLDSIKSNYEIALKTITNIYYGGNNVKDYFAWCNGIKSGKPLEERLDFANLIRYVIPLERGQQGDGNSDINHLFTDMYEGVSWFRSGSAEMLNRFRMEFIPIVNYIEVTFGMLERLGKKESDFKNINLSKSKKYYDELIRFKRSYSGSFIGTMFKMRECLNITLSESKRRVYTLVDAHKTFVKEIVHPLIVKVKEEKISLNKANTELAKLHKNIRGYKEKIIMTDPKNIEFITDAFSFTLRTKLFLTEGLKYKGVDIPAIVGEHLRSEISPQIYQSKSSTGLIRRVDYKTIPFNKDKEVFSLYYSRKTMDVQRGNIAEKAYSEWGSNNLALVSPYDKKSFGLEAIKIFTDFAILNKVSHYDYSQSQCRLYPETVNEENCLKERVFDLKDVAETMLDIYDDVDIESEEESYLTAIGGIHLYSSKKMDTALKMDINLTKSPFMGIYPVVGINGLFDIPYELIVSDYGGDIYNSPNNRFSRVNGGDSAVLTCLDRRSCWWGTEEERLIDFYETRAEQPGNIFNYDIGILKADYQFVKDSYKRKWDLLEEIETKGQEILDSMDLGDRAEIRYNLEKPPVKLFPLSSELRDADRRYREIFLEKTGGYFLKEPNWAEYTKWAD